MRKIDIPVIMCIGTSAVSGDSLGPLVGDLLRQKYNLKAFIYGTTTNNINGKNFCRYASMIENYHKDNFVIAVDACVGCQADVGKVKLSPVGVKAGEALQKNFRNIGDLGILGVVCPKDSDNMFNLMQVPFSFVESMSEKIAKRVIEIVRNREFVGSSYGKLFA